MKAAPRLLWFALIIVLASLASYHHGKAVAYQSAIADLDIVVCALQDQREGSRMAADCVSKSGED